MKNAARHPFPVKERGITVVGALETRGSLGKVLRDFVRSLQEAGIPCQTYSTSPRRKVADSDVAGLLTPKREFRAARFPCVVEMFDGPFPAEQVGVQRATIAFWEFETGLFEVHPELAEKPWLVGMSDFNAACFAALVRPGQRTSKILYPFRRPTMAFPPPDEIRAKFGLSRDDFAVFFNFDYGSSVGRKNPDGVIRAFSRAFSRTPAAKLVFKTQGAASHPAAVAEILNCVREHGVADRFVSIDRFLPEADVYGLTNACDVYVSLHRGEGFGLGIAEAMSLGKPVVVANCSAPTEFCAAGTVLSVPCRPVPLTEQERREHPFLRAVREWSDPDVEAAAVALRRLYDDPALRARLGAAARAFVADHFSPANFKRSVEAFLDEVTRAGAGKREV